MVSSGDLLAKIIKFIDSTQDELIYTPAISAIANIAMAEEQLIFDKFRFEGVNKKILDLINDCNSNTKVLPLCLWALSNISA